jgi:hypothetical protein
MYSIVLASGYYTIPCTVMGCVELLKPLKPYKEKVNEAGIDAHNSSQLKANTAVVICVYINSW